MTQPNDCRVLGCGAATDPLPVAGPAAARPPARAAVRFCTLIGVMLVGACAAIPDSRAPEASRLLKAGIQAYDDGHYPEARTRLRDALEEGLVSRQDRTTAHKYLAFIYCSSREIALCKDAFRRALEIDANFTLTPAEAGHPGWGPVFRLLKGKVTP